MVWFAAQYCKDSIHPDIAREKDLLFRERRDYETTERESKQGSCLLKEIYDTESQSGRFIAASIETK